MKIVADDKIPYLKGTLEKFASIEYLPFAAIVNDSIVDADALFIRTRTKCGEKLLKNSRVKFIATATSGNDHIDIDYCNSAGIRVYTAKGCNARAVAQYVITGIIQYAVTSKMDLTGKTVGIIGVGHVGRWVAKMVEMLGMKTLLNDPPRQENEPWNRTFSALDNVLENSDIITLHVPLVTDGPFITNKLVSANFFSKTRKNALIINTSRGEVVDEKALIAAYTEKLICGFILDVWNNEPDIDRNLPGMAFLCSPHIAGYSEQGKKNATEMILKAFFDFYQIKNEVVTESSTDKWIPYHLVCKDNNVNSVLSQLTSFTTGIPEISEKLKASPGLFESFRSSYLYRNEFQLWCVETVNTSNEINQYIEKTGFHVKQ